MILSERSLGSAVIAACALGALCATLSAQATTAMTLPDAMSEALNSNPRIAAATARVGQVEAGVALAKSRAEPAINLTATGRLQGPQQTIDIPIPPGQTINITRTDNAAVDLGVVWPLWTGGRVRAATGMARAQTSAAEADLQQATEQLLYEVAMSYYGVLRAQAASSEAETRSTSATENVRTSLARQDAGLATEADVSAAEAMERQALQVVSAAINAVTDAEQSLNTLIARPLATPVLLMDESFRFPGPDNARDDLPVALAARPELLAVDRRRDAAGHAIAMARAERRPTLAAIGQVGWQTPTDVGENHQEFFGLEFSWPILHHPGARAQEKQAKATVQEIAETRRGLADAVEYQVSESARRVADAEELVGALTQHVNAAMDAAARARSVYDAGAATRQQLVVAETSRDAARARASQAGHAASAAHLSRARALGLMRTLVLIPAGEANQG